MRKGLLAHPSDVSRTIKRRLFGLLSYTARLLSSVCLSVCMPDWACRIMGVSQGVGTFLQRGRSTCSGDDVMAAALMML
jgi:hypothetical protein